MTREEVNATVGAPPGEYRDGAIIQDGRGPDFDQWLNEDGFLDVLYRDDRAEKVVVGIAPRPALWVRVRRRLGL